MSDILPNHFVQKEAPFGSYQNRFDKPELDNIVLTQPVHTTEVEKSVVKDRMA